MKGCIIAAAAAAALFATGCISANKNDGGDSNLRPCTAKDTVHVKYEVGDKQVAASEELHSVLGFINWGLTASHIADQADDSAIGIYKTPIDVVKNGAYAKACDAAGCDSIVATRYKVTVEDFYVYARYKAEIVGYPAKVTGVEIVPPSHCDCATGGGSSKVNVPINLKF